MVVFDRHEKAWSFSLESEMKCFELTEDVQEGLRVVVDPCDDISFRLGEERPTDIPLGQTFVRLLREGGIQGAVRLHRADVLDLGDNKHKLSKERDVRDRRALLAVRTAAAPNGQVRVHANSYSEVEENGRVSRKYNDFPTPGISLVASGQCIRGDTTWEEFLLVLVPGASFRVARNGDLEGAAPEMVVAWNGYKMRSEVPRKFRRDNDGNYAPAPRP
jgi:hypothetical protein